MYSSRVSIVFVCVKERQINTCLIAVSDNDREETCDVTACSSLSLTAGHSRQLLLLYYQCSWHKWSVEEFLETYTWVIGVIDSA